MTFNLSDLKEIESDDDIAELFYLNYKTSDQDSMKKYIFGDICRYLEKKPKDQFYIEKEINFDLGNPTSGAKAFRANSFERGLRDASDLANPSIAAFRHCLERETEPLLELMEKYKSLYLNFRFGANRLHWYQLPAELNSINNKLLSQFVETVPGLGYTLNKSLYKTLGSGKESAPQFTVNSLYKSWVFPSLDSVSDLMFAIDVSQRAMIRRGDLKIVVLPRSDDSIKASRLSALQIEEFLSLDTVGRISARETALSDTRTAEVDDEEDDEVTEPLLRAEGLDTITRFDVVFSRASSSPSTPDVDLVEITGISKSRISDLDKQIRKIRQQLETDRELRLQKKRVVLKRSPSSLNISVSLKNILGDVGREKKKFSSHLLKILPQIYCGTYLRDEILMPTFIDTVERKIRDGGGSYDFLRYDLLFLLKLQDENRYTLEREDTIVPDKIQSTTSYKIGQLLGRMARPLPSKINSFEKNYVGLLSRRIAQLNGVVAFQNFLDQKLIIHDRLYPNLKAASRELAALINNFPITEAYDSEHCAFGFFESYFEPPATKSIEAQQAGEAMEDQTITEK